MKISVIIPTLNEENEIGNILKNLSNQTKTPHEVIVIDAGSKDNTRAIVNQFPNTILKVQSEGVALQRTAGGKLATGEVLVFLDGDTQVSSNFIETVEKYFHNQSALVAIPRYSPRTKNWIIKSVFDVFNSIFLQTAPIQANGAGMAIFCSKPLFEKSEGFNQTYKFDDIAFLRHASKLGQFKALPFSVSVSARRFETDGIINTTLKYLLLSPLFTLGFFKAANHLQYSFGHYKKN